MNDRKYGKVYFIGAGPGDPELLTLKAARILSEAEVVITDRLVSEAIIRQHVKCSGNRNTGRQAGRSNASTPQPEINDIIVQFAAAYKKVVRLKEAMWLCIPMYSTN